MLKPPLSNPCLQKDDSELVAAGSPKGWYASLCPKTCGLCTNRTATCHEAVQWISPAIDTACKNDDGTYRCSSAECQVFLYGPVNEYTSALKTCSGAYAEYARLHDVIRVSLLSTATMCGVELGFELTSCEVGIQMIMGIDANCPRACSDCEEDCDDEVLRHCEEHECERTPDSCAASGEGKCQEFLDKWSNRDDILAVVADTATCTSGFEAYAGYSDLIVHAFEVIEKECGGICEGGNDDFTF
jgi:hypothetical protein